MILATFGDGQVAYSLLWFFLFFIEIWLEISVFIDIFRSHDLKGWAKGLWVLFVIVFPIIGILAYFIFRGDKMRARFVILANGILTTPKLARIEGMETFAGQSFHTSRWEHEHDLTGKVVAVVGTGSTASRRRFAARRC